MSHFPQIVCQAHFRHLRLLFLLVLLFGGLGALRAEVSEPDSLRGERIGAFDREKLERSFGLVRFRSSVQARYALDLGDESWYLGSVKMDDFYREFATEYTAPWKLIPLGERLSRAGIVGISYCLGYLFVGSGGFPP